MINSLTFEESKNVLAEALEAFEANPTATFLCIAVGRAIRKYHFKDENVFSSFSKYAALIPKFKAFIELEGKRLESLYQYGDPWDKSAILISEGNYQQLYEDQIPSIHRYKLTKFKEFYEHFIEEGDS